MTGHTIDKTYWKNLSPPLSPNDDDVAFFQSHLLKGTTLLLGCTNKLINLSDFQMDLDPWYEASSVIQQNWCENNKYYQNIIGDGVLNLDSKLAEDIILMCKKNCKRFITRSFNRKLPIMKVASFFPNAGDFSISPSITLALDTYSFFVWDF